MTRALASFLYGVSPHEPLIFVAIGLLVVTIAVVANSIPAYIGTRVDPKEILRHE